jgi:spermidine synthase
MTTLFEELDFRKTPLGELVLRRRTSPAVPDGLVYEVKIDNDLLMSSSVNVSERALAHLAMAGRSDRPCHVLIGGLGLGYTAAAALEYACVRRVVVVEFLAPVIAWHRNRLVPMAAQIVEDPRCSLVEGDFFEYVGQTSSAESERYDVILVDIDHSPECWLHTRHGDFYSPSGLQGLAERLQPGGVFGLWSASKPAAEFLELVAGVFPDTRSHEVSFLNPHLNERDSNWVIIAAA